MNRESRTLLIVVVFAVGGVAALGYMAQRYGRLLEQRKGSTPAAAPADPSKDLDAFIEVREAMLRAIAADPAGRPPWSTLERVRDEALTRSVLDLDRYLRIGRLYRAWRKKRLQPGGVWDSSFDEREEQLSRLDLGIYEPLDS